MIENSTNDPVLAAAKRAFATTPFYRQHYGAEPACLDDVPFVNHSSFHSAHGITDCVVDIEQMAGSCAAYVRNQRRFPFTVLSDDAEGGQRHRRLRMALANLDIAEPRRFTLLVNDACGPFACEIVQGLSWERHQASLLYHDGDDDLLLAQLQAMKPDYVLVVCPLTTALFAALSAYPRIVVRHTDHLVSPHEDCPSWLYCDEQQLIGWTSLGRQGYISDPETLAFELEPVSMTTHISTVDFSFFPLIRYGVGVHIPLLNEDVG